MEQRPNILVIGSLNADLVQNVAKLPRAGETLRGGGVRTFAGGKGGNQAVAAARMGGRVSMIAQVGRDSFAEALLESLRTAGVDTEQVGFVDLSSGTAIIFVLPNGENSIIISPGANATLSHEDIASRLGMLRPASIVLCQLEIPLETVEAALKLAKQKQAITLLDPAPAHPDCRRLLPYVDFLTPNETEALELLGRDQPIENADDAKQVAHDLRQLGAASVILKLGALGCYVDHKDGSGLVSGLEVDAVDTTAAGDTFNGAFACALGEGRTVMEAARFANAAAALSVTCSGAQSSIPAREEVDEFLERSAAGIV